MTTAVLPRPGFLPSFSLGKLSRSKPGTFLKRYGLFSLFLFTLPFVTVAGTDTTFDGIYNVIVGWATGSLGKLIAVAAFVIVMGIGLVRQSVIAIVIGSLILAVLSLPNIIDGIVTFAI